jgi:hypothetical protein
VPVEVMREKIDVLVTLEGRSSDNLGAATCKSGLSHLAMIALNLTNQVSILE